MSLIDETPRDRQRGVRNANKFPIREGHGSDAPLPDFLAFADATFRKMQAIRKSTPGKSAGQLLSDWIADSERHNGWSLAAMEYVPAERHLPLVDSRNPDPWTYDANGKAVSVKPPAQHRPWDADTGAGGPRPRPTRPAPVSPRSFPSANRHLRERGLTGVPSGPDDVLPPGSRGTYFDQQANAADPAEPGQVGFRTRYREAAREVFRNMTNPDELSPGPPAQEICICWQWTKDPLAKCRFGHGSRGGCFYLHRCSFIGEDGWPCQNPFPCRAIEHYWLYVDTYGHAPRWYNPSQADLDFCRTQEELRVLSRPQGLRAGDFTYAWGAH